MKAVQGLEDPGGRWGSALQPPRQRGTREIGERTSVKATDEGDGKPWGVLAGIGGVRAVWPPLHGNTALIGLHLSPAGGKPHGRCAPRGASSYPWPSQEELGGVCAPRGASSYPRRSWEELGGIVPGLSAYLDAKARGDNSMPRSGGWSGGVQGYAPRDPRDMAKAGLPDAQSPVTKSSVHRNDACNRCRAVPWYEHSAEATSAVWTPLSEGG